MHSTIAVADIPSYLFVEPNALDDILIGRVIERFAFDSPIVQAARADLVTYNRTKRQHAAFNGIFERGFYLWPLNLTIGYLDGRFRPAILHDEEVSWGPLPPETEAAFAHIAACFASIVAAARTNRINVVDMDDKPVHASVWRRPGITIDLKTSDLYEISMEQWQRDSLGNGLLRRGLWLSVPASVDGATPSSITARAGNTSLPKPKTTAKAKGPGTGPKKGSRPGRREVYDADRLRKDIEAHLTSKGPFLYPESFVKWCCEHTHPRDGMSRPKPNDYPDPKTIKALIERHNLDKIKGLFARR